MEAGLSGRCPECGEGRLFSRWLTFEPRCLACGADFAFFEDAGDGPAVFVIFIVGILIMPIPVLLSLALGWSGWLLRMLRGVIFAQGWAKHAREQQFKNT